MGYVNPTEYNIQSQSSYPEIKQGLSSVLCKEFPSFIDIHGGGGGLSSLTFDTEQETYHFYNTYGERLGFSIRKGYVNKSKEGQITSRLFVCNKEGFRAANKRDLLTKILECVHMLLSQRKISTSQAAAIELAEQSGIRLDVAFELMGREVSGRESLALLQK
ncbi:hypothetical protein ACSBR2_025518 [Camellia fascicularis]